MVGVAGVVGCARVSRHTPDDTLVVLIEAAMITADPRYTINGLDNKLGKLVHVGLTVVESPSQEPELALASKIDRIDDLTWDVSVRPDAKFSDGSPVTADDVAGTYRELISPDSESLFHKGFAERFTAIDVTGDRTVRFHLKTPLATFVTDVDFGILSYHHGKPESGKSVGAGPFMVREITSTHVLLDANPYYFGPAPKTPHIEIKFVRDGAARLLMLVGGSADLVQNAARPDLLDDIRGRPRVKLEAGPSVFLTYLLINNTDPLFKDRRVRQAFAMAIDRSAIVAARFGGRARLATGLLPEAHWAYAHDAKHWDHDVVAAKQLLEEAGFHDPDGDGPLPRRTPTGVPFKVVYKTSSDAFRVAVAGVIAAQLGSLGIAVEVRSFEFATFFADVKKGTYQIASMQTAEITEPDFYFTYFHSSWIPTAKNPDGYNRWRYNNPEVDRLTEAGRRELDHEKRKAIYGEVQRIVSLDVPIVPLWHEDNVVISNEDVRGFTITPNARLVGLRDTWKLPQK